MKVQQAMDPSFGRNFAEEVYTAIQIRVDNISDEEVRKLEKSSFASIFSQVEVFLKNALPERSQKLTEILALKIALRFLRCPYLEKKLTGLNDIKVCTKFSMFWAGVLLFCG